MSEQTNIFRDDTLNLDQAYYYALLLLVDADSFSYAVTFKTQLLAYGTNCALSELTEPAQLRELLIASYKKITVGLTGNAFTLVPQPIFSADHIKDFARLLDVKPNEKVLAHVLDEKNQVVYKVDEQRMAAVNQFNNKNLVFGAQGLIRVIAQNNPINKNLYLHLTGNRAEFIYFRHNNLRFYNTFEFKNANDVVYYSALVAQEIEMLPNYAVLVVSGNINNDDELYTNLAGFFSEVILNKVPLLELPAQLSSHQVLQLAALSLCESLEAV
jgi:hypothetical protein